MSGSGTVLGFPVHAVNMKEAVELVLKALSSGSRLRVVTLNPEMVMAARRNNRLAEAVCRGGLVVPDGYGVVWALRRSGFQGQERVAGVDLVERVLKAGVPGGIRLYLLGGRPGVAEEAGKRLAACRPGIRVVGTAHGYFPPPAGGEIIKKINEACPQLLLVGMGVPRQELWLAEHWDNLQAAVGMGVGGALDVWAGKVSRTPLLFRKLGLEWLFRTVTEPARFGRILVLPCFVRMVLREKR